MTRVLQPLIDREEVRIDKTGNTLFDTLILLTLGAISLVCHI